MADDDKVVFFTYYPRKNEYNNSNKKMTLHLLHSILLRVTLVSRSSLCRLPVASPVFCKKAIIKRGGGASDFLIVTSTKLAKYNNNSMPNLQFQKGSLLQNTTWLFFPHEDSRNSSDSLV